MPGRACRPVATHWRRTRDPRTVRNPGASTTASGRASPRVSCIVRSTRSTAGSRCPLMRRTTYSATSTEHDVPRDAASVATAPERRSWMSASPVTSVRRQPPRTVRERPRPSARMVTGLSSATPQSSDSPTHMIQSVDASASQTRHRSCAHRVAVPGSRPLARHDAARAAHFFAWHHAHRAGAAAPTSTRRQGLRGGDRAPSAQVNVDLADVARALDHRRARCEERTPVATEGERFRRARGATIPAKSAAKLTPRPRDTRVSVLSFRSYWARSMPLMWVQCRSARSPSCSWDRP